MPEPTNKIRGERVEEALLDYGRNHEGLEVSSSTEDDLEDTFTDMIADLFHLAHSLSLRVNRIAEMAKLHFEIELDQEEPMRIDG